MDETKPINPLIDPNGGKSEDLKLISQWARKGLFPTVQFIYDSDKHCSVPSGIVYKFFLEDMKNRLVGVKLLQGRSEKDKYDYIVSLWKEVTKKKTNLVTEGLNARRSAVYSAMQNRFVGTLLKWRM